jgi:hypothetical protein
MTYEELVDDVLARNADVQATKMMGMPSLKANGKLFAGSVPDEDAAVFKLGGDEHAAALALEGAHLFEPMAARDAAHFATRAARRWVEVLERARPPAEVKVARDEIVAFRVRDGPEKVGAGAALPQAARGLVLRPRRGARG